VPTHSVADVRRKITPPDVVELATGGRVLLALTDSEPFFGEPKEQKRDPAKVKLDTIGGRGIVYLRWLVAGGAGDSEKVTVTSVKGGRHSLQAAGPGR
jgi:hypothetical protein